MLSRTIGEAVTEAVVFDVMGTVFDLSPLRERLAKGIVREQPANHRYRWHSRNRWRVAPHRTAS
jgi:hypothetical protein